MDLLDPVTRFCEETLPGNSIFGFLHGHRETLFPDSWFTDLFAAHSGVAWLHPIDVHHGRAETVRAVRAEVLNAAYARNPRPIRQ